MLAPVRTVAPAETPVSLAEAKAHLRVEHSDDDTLIGGLIAAATDHLDGWSGILGRCLVTQTWRQDIGGFSECMRLPLGPVAPSGAVTSIAYVDQAGTEQVLDSVIYRVTTDARGPYVGRSFARTWPATMCQPDAVRITYVAGVPVAEVPPALKVAILLLIGQWYRSAEVSSEPALTELPFAVSALIAPFRRIGV